MIIGLAGVEADRLGSQSIGPEHIVLGAIRESEYWATFKVGGPRNLMTAIDAAGTDPDALESEVMHRNG